MRLYGAFLQPTQLAQFSGAITYNSSGFAVLPSYDIIWIYASMQPLKRSEIRFLPEGTHYADYLQTITNYPVYEDSDDNDLGNYFIYNNNKVYKPISDQSFLAYPSMPSSHVETTIVRDNRITFDGTSLSLPVPQIDGQYAPLFEVIAMVNQCFATNTGYTPSYSSPLTTLWSFQQELQPPFPYCTVTIENVENVDNTNNVYLDVSTQTQYTNISRQLIIKFSFYSLDMIQALNLMEQFKLNYANYTFSTEQFAFIGFVEESNNITEQLYEDRTIFNATVRMRFSWIVEQTNTSNQTINTVAFTLSIPPT